MLQIHCCYSIPSVKKNHIVGVDNVIIVHTKNSHRILCLCGFQQLLIETVGKQVMEKVDSLRVAK